MPNIRFLYGKNLSTETPIKPGTFYLDLETNELWFDNPSDISITQHNKIIDSKTLVYAMDADMITYDPDILEEGSSNNTAKLGIAILGKMMLGVE